MPFALTANWPNHASPLAPFPQLSAPAIVPVNARANYPANYPERLGALLGRVDLVDTTRICGWAQNIRQPDVKVRLEILIDGVLVAETLADRYREDLRRAGIGIGEHGFEVALPPGLLGSGPLTIRRAADGAVIEGWHQTAMPRTWRRTPATHGPAA